MLQAPLQRQQPAPSAALPLLGVAALQLETRLAPTEENLAHIEALLDRECRRLGVRRWDQPDGADSSGRGSGTSAGDGSSGVSGGGGGSGGGGSVHLDVLVLPEIFNTGYLMTEAAWYCAEGLAGPQRSPSLRALAAWAARYGCYTAATLLEATADGHIYNSLVLAAPDGSFVTHPPPPATASSSDGRLGCPSGGSGSKAAGSQPTAGTGSSSGAGGGPSCSGGGGGKASTGSVALVRKCRASSLEGFVFRSAGAPGRGGEPAAHIVEVDAAPLLAKRGFGGSSSSSGGSGGTAGASGGSLHQQGGQGTRLRLAFAICYENFCAPPMEAIREAHLAHPLHLLIAPFCAMAPRHDHPTFGWPKEAAERFVAQAEGVSAMHAAKLGVHTVACHHTGPWASPLPRLLPFLPRDPVPISGPMLGCPAIYGPSGSPLVQLARGQEGLALAHLPLLQAQQPAADEAGSGASTSSSGGHHANTSHELLAGGPLAGVLGAAAAASADAGPASPYARYPGGYVVEPASWHVRYGFPLMEALGSLSYHLWQAPQRRRVARTIAAHGVWHGPVPALGGTTA